MREILFRGKRMDNGEWVYGQLWINKSANRETAHIVVDYGMERVILETVSQYTGINDKNGAKIFEGDIVVFRNSFGKNNHVRKIRYYSNCKPISDDGKHCVDIAETNNEDLDVIDNIHDNPGLLEAK